MRESPVTTLAALGEALAGTHGDRTAVVDEGRRLSFRQLQVEAEGWQRHWQQLGLGEHGHIGLLAANGCDWLAAAFGCWRAGATLVPISTFVSARELAEVVAHADLDALLIQRGLRSRNFLELLHRSTLPKRLKHIIVLDDLPQHPPSSAVIGTTVRSEGIACILYTSGTTGRPKGVMLSHRALLATTFPTAERSGLDHGDSLLSSLPLFWVAGLAIRALPTLASGCQLILMKSFSADGAIAALEQHRPTALHLRPPQIGQLLGHPRFHPRLLANVRKGNGRVEWFAGHLPADARFITGYGMTEMAGYVTALDWRDPAEIRRDTIGTPLPGVEVDICSADGDRLGAGEVGEIVVAGPGMFSGYYREQRVERADAEPRFRTGDLGRIDAAGSFHFAGRSKDLLRVKGINVSPLEVETVLAAHPSVETAYVIGLPPDGLDQQLVAMIVARTEVDESGLRAHAALELSHYKCPQTYLWLERHEVPLGQTSKPQRSELAALAQQKLSFIDD